MMLVMVRRKTKLKKGGWANRLRKLQERLNLTNIAMAAKLSVQPSTYVSWLYRTDRNPSRLAQTIIKDLEKQ